MRTDNALAATPKVLMLVLLAIATLTIVISCTQQDIARNWGGSDRVELPAGQRLVTVVWHDDDIWYLTRPLHDDETPETYTLQESSSWGLMQGSVLVSEHR